MTMAAPPVRTLDLVIPVYNEEAMLGALFDDLDRAFSGPNLLSRNIASVRYLFVDDGSSDGSAQEISDRIRAGRPAMLLRLSRNFGHQSAVSAGLDHATADLVAVMDADLQDPPAVVLEMIDRTADGYNVVFAQRRRRKETIVRRAGYWTFYRLVNFLADVPLPLDSGDFCLMDRLVVKALHDLPERVRFPRVLRSWVGFRQTGIEYDRPARTAGSSKYSLTRLYQLATDGIVAASVRPLKVAQFLSFVMGGIALASTAVFALMAVGQIRPFLPIPFLLTFILVSAGNALTLFCLYIFGGYLGRLYLEVKGRPPYIVMEVVQRDAREVSRL
jgi:polyisoprenyl-phosphate glycosyltransferase